MVLTAQPILFKRYNSFRDGPFNFQGGLWFFLKKYSDSQCCWKNILILVEEKKLFWFCHIYNLMLNSGKKFCSTKKKYSNSGVVQKKNLPRSPMPDEGELYFLIIMTWFKTTIHLTKNGCTYIYFRGGSKGGCTRRVPPLKLEKIWSFLHKIVIFHTKYPRNFHAERSEARLF